MPAALTLDLAPDPVCVVGPGGIAWVNARWREVLGQPGAPDGPAVDLLTLIHPDDRDLATAWLAAANPGSPAEFHVAQANGIWAPARWTARRAPGTSLTVVAARVAVSGAPRTRFASVNTSSAVRAVLEADDLTGALTAISAAVDDFHAGGAAHFLASDETFGASECIALARGATYVSRAHDDAAVRCTHAAAGILTVCLPVRSDDQEFGVLVVEVPAGGIASEELVPRLENVSVALAEVAARRALSVRALTDAVTRLPNRAAFMQAINRCTAALQEAPGSFGVLMLDLDHFKQVNDTLGHQAGDAVLVATARRMADAVRDGDLLARLGGDEFAILVSPCDRATLADVCERVRRSVAAAPDDERHGTTASIGAVRVAGPGITWDEIYEQADAALYRAKQAGRDRVVVGAAELGV
jgi:diguanylate cyclase (GGDEF)-like protein